MTHVDAVASVPLRRNVHHRRHVVPPPHHVVAVSGQTGIIESLPFLPTFFPTAKEELHKTDRSSVFVDAGPSSGKEDASAKTSNAETKYVRSGFRNPWPSWHKPDLGEVWNGMSWGEQTESLHKQGVVEFATQEDDLIECESADGKGALLTDNEKSAGEDERDLAVVEPTFRGRGEKAGIAQATWLGHASVLLELPPLHKNPVRRPLRLLFDPIFSMRCSPTQYLGPLRYHPSPCSIASLPEIDVVLVSHSHYDHLDYDSIVQLWQANQDHLQFLVPLGDRDWFLALGIGIGDDRVTELDWWDEAWLDQQDDGTGGVDREEMLRVICTPAQHGSGRYGIDASRSLWCSWTLEHISHGSTYRIFFGGDTGYQFHPPVPSSAKTYPACPAFAEITEHIGKPDLSFLPISVGASFNFVKSYDVLGLVPRLDHGLTAANHLTPDDAVRVAKVMQGLPSEPQASEAFSTAGQGVAVAIHWGTFVSSLAEIRASKRDLRNACKSQGVDFIHSLDQREGQRKTQGQCPLAFACLDIGQSVYMDLRQT